ncbi:sulfurtransferase [Pontibacter actiniarum]|uniref:Sulfurtransferase n=1 Tax=Pontibacter actiniarum TaxID=323450 RepID=A0A1X9YY82_9BACT|nr:sulfurtransferase [Pontibacter actiniarum]ARS37772.1 sulfurtransferase [Pontibacter actiniarum]
MVPIIKPHALLSLGQKQNLVLVDVRTGPDARLKYNAAHLKGALYVDLEQDLANKNASPADGGRHPLPGINRFSSLLGQLGIAPESHVVVYDDKYGANAAARFWWMLRAAGHTQVQVMDGGYQAAVAVGVPTGAAAETPAARAPYPFEAWHLPTADINQTANAARAAASLVIDVRAPERFRGEKEPIDLVAGHIPGAVNIPFTTNLDASGFFVPPGQLYTRYRKALCNRKAEDVVVHCGSGVTACHTMLAMDYAGLGIPQLYVGSWSEWSRNERPVATGIEVP